ncbi:alkaline phosphatase family protein [Nocardioides panacisoli]|uniref:alkaline phosphatase family protein n=1 Tax=Nocardioides panacisoli TaxID=627624 RepID=UPI001C62DB98|nr:alkaline phosphatase family protein [Nocardioides panacisoli]QYJ03205.1 alkaline phosphatase family protein [Nocardioides panacisoli]
MCSRLLATALAALLLATGCGGGQEASAPTPAEPSSTTASASAPSELDSAAAEDLGDRAEEIAGGEASGTPSTSAPGRSASPTREPERAPQVVAISIDGLRASAIDDRTTPTLRRLLARGAGTLNARTAVEQTETMPNHVCMVTGRPIGGPAGHGVTWNVDTEQTVRDGVQSVFNVVAGNGGSSAVVVGKSKLDILRDSWPPAVADFRIEARPDAAASAVLDRVRSGRDLVFWHLPGPDKAGHAAGFGSGSYRTAVARADAAVGALVDAITGTPALARSVSLVLTSDHGGTAGARGHNAADSAQNFTVPFVVWGPDVAAGDLYGLNPAYADPAGGRPSYAGAQPVRNCDLANAVTGLLGLPDVPGSRIGAGGRLRTADD